MSQEKLLSANTVGKKPVTESYPEFNCVTVASTSSTAMKTDWKSAWAASCARLPAPRDCIYIEAAENTDAKRISAGERYARVYNIDYSRCIFCGYCVEACPTDAITHGHGFELAPYGL